MTEIYTRERCRACDGKGVVYDPLWRECNKYLDTLEPGYDFTEEIKDFFAKRGYSEIPEEECGVCEGSGLVCRWVEAWTFISRHSGGKE